MQYISMELLTSISGGKSSPKSFSGNGLGGADSGRNSSSSGGGIGSQDSGRGGDNSGGGISAPKR